MLIFITIMVLYTEHIDFTPDSWTRSLLPHPLHRASNYPTKQQQNNSDQKTDGHRIGGGCHNVYATNVNDPVTLSARNSSTSVRVKPTRVASEPKFSTISGPFSLSHSFQLHDFFCEWWWWDPWCPLLDGLLPDTIASADVLEASGCGVLNGCGITAWPAGGNFSNFGGSFFVFDGTGRR